MVKVGDIGTTVSVLKPVGKALINDTELEVKTGGSYLENGRTVRVTSISLNQIIVEPTN